MMCHVLILALLGQLFGVFGSILVYNHFVAAILWLAGWSLAGKNVI
jgi:hypothetical protein